MGRMARAVATKRANEYLARKGMSSFIEVEKKKKNPDIWKSEEEILVWRVENMETGKGPFTCSRGDRMDIDMRVVKIEPSYTEVCDLIGGGYYFGWKNPIKLWAMMNFPLAWHEAGFRIVVYRSNYNVIFSDQQVAFHKCRSELVETLTVREFHKKLDELFEQYDTE